MLRFLPVLLFLSSGCGLVDQNVPKPKPTKVVSRALITNKYAVSLFTLTVTPNGSSSPITLFTNQRIESGDTATSSTFDLPLGGSEVAFNLVGTSLGEKATFSGKAPLGIGAERLILSYDFDLAVGDFSVEYGTQADPGP